MSNFKELVRIGKDAVTRFTHAGKAVTGFSAAFDNGWGDRKQTVWLDCSVWGERGEKLAQYLTKGSLVLVEGDIGTREHDGKTYLTLDVREVKLTGFPRHDALLRKGAAVSTPKKILFMPTWRNNIVHELLGSGIRSYHKEFKNSAHDKP